MRRQTIPVVLGLVLGLLGTGLVVSYVRGVERSARDGSQTVAVWVATRTIESGTPGSQLPRLAERRSVPRRYAPPGALADQKRIGALFALERIGAGETILSRHFGSAAVTRGSLAIPKGKEAVTIGVPVDAGLARYAAPGDRVSVFATFKGGSPQTVKILAGVEVLATEARSAGPATAAGSATQLTITLAVTPEEAARLVYGTEIGSLWLSLVPQGQTSPSVAPFSIAARKE